GPPGDSGTAIFGKSDCLVERGGVDTGRGVELDRRPGRLHGLGCWEAAPASALPARRSPVELVEGASGGLLFGRLLGCTVSGAKRVGAGVDPRGVFPLPAAPRASAVVIGRQPEPLLHHLLQAALEVLVLDRLRQ